MNPTLLITLCTFFFLQPSIAQGQSIPIAEGNVPAQEVKSHQQNPDDQSNCGTDARHEHLMATDATYRQHFLYHTHQLDAVLNSTQYDRSAFPPPYTIPVVVHVIHLGVGDLGPVQSLDDLLCGESHEGIDDDSAEFLACRASPGIRCAAISRAYHI